MRKIILTILLTVTAVLMSGCEQQEPSITIENTQVSEGTVTFDLEVNDPDDALSTMDVILYDDSDEEVTRLSESDLDGIEKFEGSTFSNLAEDSTYTITVQADYELSDETNEGVAMDTATIETDAYLDLGATFENTSVSGNEITFDLEVSDPEELISEFTVVLLGPDGESVAELGASDLATGMNEDVSFWNLHYDTGYTIEVRADYTDGHVTREDALLGSQTVTTESAKPPSASIEEDTVEGHAYTFDLQVDDPSGIITNLEVILYDDTDSEITRFDSEEDDLTTGLNEALQFSRLAYDTTHSVEVVADYHLDNTLSEDETLDTNTFTTGAYAEPSGTLAITDVTADAVTFDATLDDGADTVTYPAVFIYEADGEDPISAITAEDGLDEGETTSLEFTGLASGATYDLVFVADHWNGQEETALSFETASFTTD